MYFKNQTIKLHIFKLLTYMLNFVSIGYYLLYDL